MPFIPFQFDFAAVKGQGHGSVQGHTLKLPDMLLEKKCTCFCVHSCATLPFLKGSYSLSSILM